jgi:hypothetical protein
VDVSHLNRLALRQSAQVPNPVNTLTSVEVRYYISPYLPDKSFKPTPSPGFTNAGYFEVMPQLLSGGETKVLAMKWNLNNKPVTYYLSANTPPEYRQAVKNGVLYWNTTLGEEIFAVADAPQGVTAPDMDRNIIQWVDFDNADSAYADIQADPRTGEILHAQVFMPSTFAVGGKKTAWQLLYMLANLPSPSSNSLISLRNMYSPRVCDLDARNRMIKGITTLLAENSADDVILRVSQAVVQEVVTHEVGHTMGLRHNFAGSLAADYAGHSREELSANFLNGGPYIKVTPSSSIMDYHDNTEAILAVNRFDVEKKALEHDTRSMRFLYRNEPLDKSIPYCTDSDLDTLDCRKFDYGNSPLAYASSELRNNLSVDVLPVKLFLNMAVEVMGGKSVTELNPSPAANATALLDNKAVLLTAFTQDGFYSRTLKRQYPGNLLKDVDKTELRKAVVPDVLTDLDAWLLSNPYGIKSAKEMFMIIDPAWKDAWIARFNQITNNPAFYNFVDPNGVTRTFTPAEREQLRTMATGFFADLIPALVTADVKQMSLPSKIDIVDGKAGEGLLGTMNATSNTYLMAREPGESLKVTVNGASLFLPVFGYDWPLRQDASRLLNNRTVPGALWWGIQETAANEASLTALLDSAVSAAGGAFSSAVVANGFTGAGSVAYEWYLENTKVVKEGF